MGNPSFDDVKESIEYRLEQIYELLGELEFDLNKCTARELYDYMTGETFTGDKTTLRDVIGSEYLLLHEVVEMSELKRLGVEITVRTLVESPKEKIYEAHLNAMGFELDYALLLEDYYWLKHRLGHHEKVVNDDPWIPDALKPRARELLDSFTEYMQY
ncbi:hypothetical protein JXL21_00330 [Candidatus Bathyarchaeota archaeon]|nr:hypothetical protein [Candidatus Bathyarchaeota archaeon]